MDVTIRKWIIDILERHTRLLAIAMHHRAKFEGWLKFELAAYAEAQGARDVEVESACNGLDSASGRSDVAFFFNETRFDIELKTPNSNWRIPGIRNKIRPITQNVAEIIGDVRKLKNGSNNGIVAFVLFPVPVQDNRWVDYLNRIATKTSICLSEQDHCSRLSIPLEEKCIVELVVCCFSIPSLECASTVR